MEMTYVQIITVVYFTLHTCRNIFLQGLAEFWTNLPVSLWRKVSQFHWKSAKKRMSGEDLISKQIWGMKDETVFKSCLSSVCDRCGLTCTIWLVAVNKARKTYEYSQQGNLTPCKQTEVTQLSEYRFNIWCPNLWMHQMFDAFQQGTGSIKIKLGFCQLFGSKSTFWGNSPTPKSLLM